MISPGKVSGFYYREGSTTHLPEAAHPTTCRKIRESVWTHQKLKMAKVEEIPVPTPGVVTASTLENKGMKATSASDGSSCPEQEVGSAADTRKRVETAEKKTKPGMQLDCNAEVEHQAKMARTQGPSKEAMRVSEGSSSDDHSEAPSSDEEDTRDRKPEKERKTRKKPNRVEVEMNTECVLDLLWAKGP